jgi:predicted nucleotidyltransferase
MAHRAELLCIAQQCGARIAICGSVARGQDRDGSDIDFHVRCFDDADRPGDYAYRRVKKLVDEFRRMLAPYRVDLYPLPTYPLGGAQKASMERDAIDLGEL